MEMSNRGKDDGERTKNREGRIQGKVERELISGRQVADITDV